MSDNDERLPNEAEGGWGWQHQAEYDEHELGERVADELYEKEWS